MRRNDSLEPVAFETHSGIVFLAGERAYKAKKAVVMPFLDFRTVDRRRAACQRELELNSRLAPDVYLGVGELTDPTGGPSEPVLFMRRMPASRRLSTLARSGESVDDVITAIGCALAKFHAAANRGPEIDIEAGTEALGERWAANLRELVGVGAGAGAVAASSIDQIDRLTTTYIRGRGPLFAERIAQHHIVDGHGDLIADDIFCLPDGPRMLDCLDFDDRLRFVDVADDLAFLQMDLEFLGRPDLAELLGAAYEKHAKTRIPLTLRHHYIAYRAVVRAKVDLLQWRQGRTHADADAVRHLLLALDHLKAGAVRIAVVGGLPGTGKTTVARALASRVGAVVLSSDVVRRQLQADNSIEGHVGEFGAGLYAPHVRDAVYGRMIELARAALQLGRSVVLDASWTRDADRIRVRQLAAETSAAMVAICCTAPPDIAAERIRRRNCSESDATPAIAAAMSAVMVPWADANSIDTAESLEATVRTVEALWDEAAVDDGVYVP